MIVRPTRRALLKAAFHGGLMVLPGALLVYAAWSSGVVVPGLFGTPLILLGLLIFANPVCSKMQLDSGILTGQSLLDRRVIQVGEITRIVPIRLTYRRTLLMPWKRSAEMFDVYTKDGPTGLWLNPASMGTGRYNASFRQSVSNPKAKSRAEFLRSSA